VILGFSSRSARLKAARMSVRADCEG
jgi:hypothetical protein